MSLSIRALAWYRTIYLLVKHRLDTSAALQETDQEYSKTVNRVILRHVLNHEEYRN